ncbi:MAG TPA: hypothetical protein VF116_20315 [Ktedonobacterales bacterium]
MAERDVDVRPLAERERSEALAALNAALPAARRMGLADWRRTDAAREQSGAVGLRLIAGRPVAGVLEVEDAATTAEREPGVVEGELYVAPAARPGNRERTLRAGRDIRPRARRDHAQSVVLSGWCERTRQRISAATRLRRVPAPHHLAARSGDL